MTIENAIRSRDYRSAQTLIGNGEKLPSDMHSQVRAQLYELLLDARQFDILKLFIENHLIETDLYEYDNFDYTLFYAIFTYRDIDDEINDFFDSIIGKFTNLNDEVKGYSLLNYAFIRGANIRIIQILLNAGCDIHFRNSEDDNILHQLIKSDEVRYRFSTEQLVQLFNQYVEILITQGVEIDDVNSKNETALLLALIFRKNFFLPVLLEKGADPNHFDRLGNNAFYYAISLEKDLNAYRLLKEYASPQLNNVNGTGSTILFHYLAELNFDSEEKNRDIIVQLINDGADLYQTCKRYGEPKTPADYLACKPVEVLKAVIETGDVYLNSQDSKGNTLLHKVCAYNVDANHDKAKETYRRVKFLIENGADHTLTNDADQTPLMLASDDNYKIKTVELLMKQG